MCLMSVRLDDDKEKEKEKKLPKKKKNDDNFLNVKKIKMKKN